ncbi:MATE family efflux transporter [Vulgatibacter incomptus]|nr:MATE family efflux transporter [Vulgatibacter incomptus]
MSLGSSRLLELRKLARLAAPLALVHAGNQLMTLVDMAFVGRLGAVALGGIGIANGIFFTVSTLGMGAMMGLDPLVSQAVGAGDPARARRWLWQGIWLALFVTIVLSIPIAIAPNFLVPFGIEEAVAREATTYLNIRLVGLYPMLVYVAVRAYLQAMGVTRPMFISVVAANLLNVAADALLVFGGEILPAWAGPLRSLPAFGVAGAAVATTLCTILQLAIITSAVGSVEVPGFERGMRRWLRSDLLAALKVGLPIGLQMAAEVSIFALVGLLVGRMGAANLAAHQVSLTLASFTFTVAVGIGAAGSVRVGRAVGARDIAGVRAAGLTAIAAGGGWMALSALVFLLAPKALAGLLTDQAGVIEAAAPLLMIAAVFQLSDGLQAAGSGVLRGAGDTRFPFLANLFGYYVIALPLGLWLAWGMNLGAAGLWWGLCTGLTVVAIALIARFRRISSRPIAPLSPMAPAAAAGVAGEA